MGERIARYRRIALIGGGATALALLAPHPKADIRILAHDLADTAPARMQAALELGGIAVSVLVTWTRSDSGY